MLDKFKIVGDEELKNEVNKYFSFNNSSTISLGNNSNLYVKNLSDNSILEIETNKEGKVIQTLENLEKMMGNAQKRAGQNFPNGFGGKNPFKF